jgi:hypothetical protein
MAMLLARFGAAGQAPGSDIGPDPLAPGIGQRVELGVIAL